MYGNSRKFRLKESWNREKSRILPVRTDTI